MLTPCLQSAVELSIETAQVGTWRFRSQNQKKGGRRDKTQLLLSGLFTQVHHIVPNKTTTRSKLVQTVNPVVWLCIVLPCNAVSRNQHRQKWLEGHPLPASVPFPSCWQPKLDNERLKYTPTHSVQWVQVSCHSGSMTSSRLLLKTYYYIKELGSRRIWTSIQFISTLNGLCRQDMQ